MPLLYVNKLAAMEKLALDDEPRRAHRESIERLLARQDSSGDFGLWSARLERPLAQRLRHRLPHPRPRARLRGAPEGLRQALDYLRNAVANATEVRNGGRRPRLRGLRARPERPAGDGRPALPRRHQDRRLLLRLSARASSPPPWRCWATAAGPRRRWVGAHRLRAAATRSLPGRLRLAPARRGRDHGAGGRDRLTQATLRPVAGRDRRGAASRARDEHAGECLDGARRREPVQARPPWRSPSTARRSPGCSPASTGRRRSPTGRDPDQYGRAPARWP